LAAEIKKALGVEVDLIRGDRGAFEVSRDGALVFSKHGSGRFPKDASEVIALLR
jgi:selT/selW/selH-like putative selenoprotein